MGYKIKTKPASMRVQRVTEKVENRTCGECSRGCWNTENRDWLGRVFLGYCEHSYWARTKDGRGVFLDTSAACDEFVEGEKENYKQNEKEAENELRNV